MFSWQTSSTRCSGLACTSTKNHMLHVTAACQHHAHAASTALIDNPSNSCMYTGSIWQLQLAHELTS